jgi:large conductance mechanosensitive channel
LPWKGRIRTGSKRAACSESSGSSSCAATAVAGKHDFSSLAFTINGSRFRYGNFVNALITFLTVAAVMFFLVIKPVNALLARLRPEPAVDQETRPCPECLSDIPVGARRCAFCTSALAAVA